MKLKSIKFKNYKVFSDEQTINIRPITILIGKNSSGKSAIAKLTTLVENSLSQTFESPLLLVNNNVDLGDEFRDLIYNHDPYTALELLITYEDDAELCVKIIQPTNKFIPIILYWSFKKENFFELSYDIDATEPIYTDNEGKKYRCVFTGFIPKKINDLDTGEEKHLNIDFEAYKVSVDYIGPFRLFPPRHFSLTGMSKFDKMGIKGEYAYHILGLSKLHETQLISEVGQWFQDHFDGWRLDVNKSNYPVLEIVLTKETKPSDFQVNIADVGQGMSQALPSVVRAFMNENDTLIVLEQPELHLHPAAHGDLAELYAQSSVSRKHTYLIETHSETFILRLRALIAKGLINHNDLLIYWIQDDDKSEKSNLKEIKVDQLGEVDYWPPGIFSESFEEVKSLGEAQYERKNKNS